MTALSPWIAAALADAEAASSEYDWQMIVNFVGIPTVDADARHIARWSPEVVIAVLAVLRDADAMPEPMFTNMYQDQQCVYCGEEADGLGNITHHPTCEWRMVREALAALAAAT